MWTIIYGETNLVSRHQSTLPVILRCPARRSYDACRGG